MIESKKMIVSGRVQGVCYRAFVQKQALKLAISGYAKNLPNGNVEVLACGEAAAIEQLLERCKKGPIMAKVSGVEVSDCAVTTAQGFDIL